jgi:hypothetical protein
MNDLQCNVGDWVEVRSIKEILKTLDQRGQLDGLPFMPQMFQYCGHRFRVYKRAHKTCDTITGDYKGRSMNRAVHLEGLRCDGQAYGGCQASCLIFWKEDWLKKVSDTSPTLEASMQPEPSESAQSSGCCREEDVWVATKTPETQNTTDPIYVCQVTQLLTATQPLSSFNLGQYAEDLASGNVGLWQMICGFIYIGYHGLANAGVGLGRPLRWLYDRFQSLWGGVPYPRKRGKIPLGSKTPKAVFDFQPGEWVRVKSYDEILSTLDTGNRNRGLVFDAEMVPFCGRTFRVLKRVTKILDEKTGKMTEFKTPSIMLEGVVCEGRYSECRLFCPRSIPSYWREIWLERVPAEDGQPKRYQFPRSKACIAR